MYADEGVVENALKSPRSGKNYRCPRGATAVERWRSKGEMGSQELSTMNAQPEENGRSKAGIVLQAAGGGSRGRALAFQPTAQLLVDFGRNLHSIFLDS